MDYSEKNRRTMSEALHTGKLKEVELAFVQGAPARPATTDNSAALSGSVSMTFRLPAALSGRLIRAATDRKLNRQPPSTQQDIVAEAVANWLKKHGL